VSVVGEESEASDSAAEAESEPERQTDAEPRHPISELTAAEKRVRLLAVAKNRRAATARRLQRAKVKSSKLLRRAPSASESVTHLLTPTTTMPT
jgi:hypothetical protein